MHFLPLILALALNAQAQSLRDHGDDNVLSATDGQGNISTVFNQFDGRNHSLQITRMSAGGYPLWTYQHADGYHETAYAAAMDSSANLFIAGVRNVPPQKYFLLMKYGGNGQFQWEYTDGTYNCTATSLFVDREDNVLVAGVCRMGNGYPVRLLKYSNNGGLLWARDYDGGGRNYLRNLRADPDGTVTLTVETAYGNSRDGSYQTRFVLYSTDGAQLGVR
ncbi:MAG: hypothetical protein WCU88_10325 [Elusimicrobiota bacterium]